MPKLPDVKPAAGVPVTSHKSSKSLIKKLNRWMFVAVCVVVVFELLIANAQSSDGRRMASLQQQHDQLVVQIDQLEREVATTSSLQRIRQYATDTLKMQPITNNVLYVPIQPTPTP